MNPNTTAQRKTIRSVGAQQGRPLGAIAHRLDSAKLVEAAREVLRSSSSKYSPAHIEAIRESHNADHVLVAVDNNRAAVINSKGVGTKEADGTVGIFVDTGFQVERVDIPVGKIATAMTRQTVDLADAIRIFGARLDSNHHQWFTAYAGTYQP